MNRDDRPPCCQHAQTSLSLYRSPNYHVTAFLDKFDNVLSIISKNNKCCYVIGDFNPDLLQYIHHVPTQEFIECLFSHAFLPLNSNDFPFCNINYNIFTNHLSTHVFTGIVLNDLSDHFPIYALFYDDVFRTKVGRNVLSARLKETI